MRRRTFGGGVILASTLWSDVVPAQQPRRIPRIGLLSNNPWSDRASVAIWAILQAELQHFGWIEGRTISFELASADSNFNRLPAVARDLVGRGVDLIVVAGGLAASAVRDATETVPVVFITVSDPLRLGLVASLARPGGNLTGLTDMSTALVGKRLQLLLEVAVGARRIGYLTAPGGQEWLDSEVRKVAASLDVELLQVTAVRESELAKAIASAGTVAAWLVGDTIRAFVRSDVVAAFAALHLPVVYPTRTLVESGGLLSYAANSYSSFRRAAWFVDRILRGARPGDIPIEEPTQLELVLNMRTARTQGITIPQAIMARADEVIE